jgi:hypothetical protein
LQVALGLPAFVGDGMAVLRAMTRANLGLFPNLPFFQRLLRASCFAAEADLAEHAAGRSQRPGGEHPRHENLVRLPGTSRSNSSATAP